VVARTQQPDRMRRVSVLQRFPVDLNQNGFPGVGEALWH
jgi:hypothetical protein